MTYKLGSLFDGSGGFPLAGSLCGVEPVWASEVEPYPIAVTRSRFPKMKHLGDISKINGAVVEPVDIITFGSPCQDLSVAGKRAGLKHEANGDEETTRSGLFMEAVRIIKEMRRATNGRYPSFALWENVPGAFSSNKGEDFRIVCEELIKIVEPTAVMPAVPKSGWPYADSYCGDRWSLAYRVFDAQYWGVPQRRRRIHLVLDLRGKRAREVLFEREGVRGYFAEGRTPWQGSARDTQDCTGADDRAGESAGVGGRGLDAIVFAQNQRDEVRDLGDKSGALMAEPGMKQQTYVAIPYTLKIRSGCEGGGKRALVQTDKSATLATNNDRYLFQPVTLEPGIAQREGGHIYEGVSGTLRANMGDNQMSVAYSDVVLDDQGGQQIGVRTDGKAPTLRAEMHGNVPCVMESAGFCPEQSAKTRGIGFEEENAPTLRAGVVPGVAYSIENHPAGLNGASISPTLISRMETATGTTQDNLIVCEPVLASGNDVTGCLMASGYEKLGAQEMFSGDYAVVEQKPVYCLQGGGATSQNSQGMGHKEGTSYTLNTTDVHGVVYALDRASFNQGENAKYDFEITDSGINSTLAARGPSAVCCTTGSFMQVTDEVSPTLMARDYKDPTCVAVNYIVRRLTPTECARLQGFADRWGDIDEKEDFTDEEYRFWLEVRNTHATVIGGKETKEYTKGQMLAWYNKLHTDSAEYKMWGNGIALPPALYVLQGMADAFYAEKEPIAVEDPCVAEVAETKEHENDKRNTTKSEFISACARLYKHRSKLTRQQVKTLKGQIVVGDIEGAMRGLDKLLRKESKA